MAGNDQQYEWLAPWEPVDDGDTSLVSELIREVSTAHCLFGVDAVALATNSAPDRYDDVLFGVDPTRQQIRDGSPHVETRDLG